MKVIGTKIMVVSIGGFARKQYMFAHHYSLDQGEWAILDAYLEAFFRDLAAKQAAAKEESDSLARARQDRRIGPDA